MVLLLSDIAIQLGVKVSKSVTSAIPEITTRWQKYKANVRCDRSCKKGRSLHIWETAFLQMIIAGQFLRTWHHQVV